MAAVQAKGNGAVQSVCGVFAKEVVGRCSSHFNGAVGDAVQNTKSGHQFSGRVGGDDKLATRHVADLFGKHISGTITVTVLEVLSNGNLNVAGEKRLAVGHEEEVIRFGGIVSPSNLQGNSVLSSQVADARIEYRGVGITDQVQIPGILTKLFTRYSPN